MQMHMHKDVYIECEKRLREYPIDRKIVDEWLERKEDVIESYSSPLAYLEEEGFSNEVSDTTGKKVVRLEKLEERIRDSLNNVRHVEDVIPLLDEEQNEIVTMYYFTRKYTRQKICDKLNIHNRTYYRKRNAAIRMFAKRMGLI